MRNSLSYFSIDKLFLLVDTFFFIVGVPKYFEWDPLTYFNHQNTFVQNIEYDLISYISFKPYRNNINYYSMCNRILKHILLHCNTYIIIVITVI